MNTVKKELPQALGLPTFSGDWYSDPISHRLIKLTYPDKPYKQLLERLKEDLLTLSIEPKSKIKRWGIGHSRILKLLILNCFIRSTTLGDRSNIVIYWDKKYYSKGNYYNDEFQLTAQATQSVINGLVELGYLLKKTGSTGKGCRNNGTKVSVKLGTRIKPTSKFAELLNEHLDLELFSSEPTANIVFKPVEHKGDDTKIVYTLVGVNQLTQHNAKKVRQPQLKRFNQLLQSTDFRVHSHVYFNGDTVFERQLRKDWVSYGRYHCHRLQNMPSGLRPYLLINGEPTVEVDIISSNVLMAYASNGLDLSIREPAYAPEGVPSDKHGSPEERENRKLLKQALLIIMNTHNKGRSENSANALSNWCAGNYKALRRTSKAIYKAQNKPTDSREGDVSAMCKAVTGALKAKHTDIQQYIEDKASGMTLMFLESEVISQVIAHFTAKNIPCLPIHDSILVPQSHEEELKAILVEKIESQFNVKFENIDKVIEVDYPKTIENELEAEKVLRLIERGYYDEKARHANFEYYEWNKVQGDFVSDYVFS